MKKNGSSPHSPLAKQGTPPRPTRPILTGYERRMAAIAETGKLPEAKRERSLRRKLTVLDRRLSDEEPKALDRLTSCIILSGRIGTSWGVSEVSGDPFQAKTESERSIMVGILKRLTAADSQCIATLVAHLNPSARIIVTPAERVLLDVTWVAARVARLYAEVDKQRKV